MTRPSAPRLSQLYDGINSRGYGEAYCGALEQAENRFVAGKIERAMRELRLSTKSPPRVLDVGCGTGEFLKSHHVAPEQYTGLDLSRLMVSEARQEFPKYASRFRCTDFLNYDPLAKPDLIVALWGPFNYAGFYRSLRWSAKTLAKGGRLCAVVYSSDHEYRDKTLYPASVAQTLRDVPPVRRLEAELALLELFQKKKSSVMPFSSRKMANATNVRHWLWTLDRFKLSVDYARDSRYLWLEAQNT